MKDKIDRIVEHRTRDYGPPWENHKTTAKFYQDFMDAIIRSRDAGDLNSIDVCFMAILAKISRYANGRLTKDTVDDIEGYCRNIRQIVEYENTK